MKTIILTLLLIPYFLFSQIASDFSITDTNGNTISPTCRDQIIDPIFDGWDSNNYGYTGKESKFSTNMRNKFRMLRLVRSMLDAKKAGKLGEYFIRSYYSASKMRFSKEELQAPFIKLQ